MNNSPQYPLQVSHCSRLYVSWQVWIWEGLHQTLLGVLTKTMKEKTQVEGYVLRETVKENNPSRVSVIVVCVGLTSWPMVSLSPFRWVPLWRVCLLLSYHFLSIAFFQTPLSSFYLSSYHICKSPFIRFQAIASLLGTRTNVEWVDLKFGLAFESPLLSFFSFFSIILLFFSQQLQSTSRPSAPLLMREWTMTHYRSLVHYERLQDGKC